MRLKFPTRVSMAGVVIYAVFIFAAQQLEHTSVAFSLLYFGFVMLAGAAFNLAGGFSTVIGSYVCWYWLFTCGLSVTIKVLLAEAADSNLAAPLLDITAYTASMAMLLLVVGIMKRFDLRKHALAVSRFADFGVINYTTAAWGFCVLGGLTFITNFLFPPSPGSFTSALNYVNIFYPIGTILGTISAIRNSSGRRGFNAVTILCMVPSFVYGFIGYSKQGMMTPIVCWLVTAAYCKLRLRFVHYVYIAAGAAFAIFFVNIWSAGRITVPEGGVDLASAVELSIYNLQHFSELDDHVKEVDQGEKEFGTEGYFNNRQGIFNRLGIIEVDDKLFAFTAKGNYEGYDPITGNFLNWIPHFLAPNKQAPAGGNTYAHEMGALVVDDDYSTGISFSPCADAFHIDGWTGVFLLLPAIWVLLFQSMDLVVGDMKRTPWGLFLVVFFAHAASESGVGIISFIFFGNLSLLVAILFTAKVAPVIGTAILGRVRQPSLGLS